MGPLAKVATRALLRPLSAAACERIFSYLTQMDAADRSLTSKETLRLELFLRGNWEILEELRAEWHADKLAGKQARVAEQQTARLQARMAAGAAAYTAAAHDDDMAAGAAAAAAALRRRGAARDDDGGDSSSSSEKGRGDGEDEGGSGSEEEGEEDEERGVGDKRTRDAGGGGSGGGGGGLRKRAKPAEAAAFPSGRPFAVVDHTNGEKSWGYELVSDSDSQDAARREGRRAANR